MICDAKATVVYETLSYGSYGSYGSRGSQLRRGVVFWQPSLPWHPTEEGVVFLEGSLTVWPPKEMAAKNDLRN